MFFYKKSQALLFVFFLLLIVGILASNLAGIWQSEIESGGIEKYNLSAFYLAQAGIERAKTAAVLGTLGSGGPYGGLTTGVYSFSVQSLGGNMRFLQSTGQAYDPNGIVAAEREVAATVDISLPSQVLWSWRER
ncbi:MAG: hypothetical protein ABH858_05665 [Candidatus Omnitrophota bacterium]